MRIQCPSLILVPDSGGALPVPIADVFAQKPQEVRCELERGHGQDHYASSTIRGPIYWPNKETR